MTHHRDTESAGEFPVPWDVCMEHDADCFWTVVYAVDSFEAKTIAQEQHPGYSAGVVKRKR